MAAMVQNGNNGNKADPIPVQQTVQKRATFLWPPPGPPMYKRLLFPHLLPGTVFMTTMQLVAGMFIVALFIFVRPMTYANACLAPTLYVVCALLVSQDNHVGTKMLGSCLVVGSAYVGTVIAASVLSIASTLSPNPSPGHTACLVCLAIFFVGVLSINRMGSDPPFLWVLGMISTLSFGNCLIGGQFVDRWTVWNVVAANLCADAIIAATIACFCALVIAPTLAADELRTKFAMAVRGIGQATSRYASRGFNPEAAPTPTPMLPHIIAGVKAADVQTADIKAPAILEAGGNSVDSSENENELWDDEGVLILDGEQGEQAYLEMLQKCTSLPGSTATSSHVSKASPGAGFGPPVASFRPLLSRARTCIASCLFEPSFLHRRPFNPATWGRAIAAAEVLLTRVAALETLLEGQGLSSATSTILITHFQVDIIPTFRQAYAQLAATCATVGLAVEADVAGAEAQAIKGCSASFGRTWQQTKEELRLGILATYRGYWCRVRDQQGKTIRVVDSNMVRTLFFLYNLTNGIINAMAEVEAATAAAICTTVSNPQPLNSVKVVNDVPKAAGQQVAAVRLAAGVGATADGRAVHGGGDGKEFVPAVATKMLPAAAAMVGENGAVGTGPPPPPPPSWFEMHFGWAKRILLICLGLPLFGGLLHAFTVDLPALLTPTGFRIYIRSRIFQAGLKYWLAASSVLVLILGLSARDDTRVAATYKPLYGFLAVCLSMSERVESTISKVSTWIIGTAIGGTLGYICMIEYELSTNPYALMAIICAFTFLVGIYAGHQMKAFIVLTLMTFTGVILCQYNGHRTGTKEFYAARVLSVTFGCVVPAILTNLILPWYLSDWSLTTIGKTFKESIILARSLYEQYYSEGEAAVVAARAARAVAGKEPPSSLLAERSASGATIASDSAEQPAQEQPTPIAKPAQLGVPTLPQNANPLQARITAPLTAVQISLMKDGTIWQHGLLATPPIVPRMLQAHFVLVDRMAAVFLALAPPAVTGTLTGWAFINIVEPLHDDTLSVLDAADRMADATAQLLGDYTAGHAAARVCVLNCIEELERRRLRIRNHMVELRRANMKKVASVSEADLQPVLESPDDGVRVFGWLFAIVKFMNAATLVARTALVHASEIRETPLSWLRK